MSTSAATPAKQTTRNGDAIMADPSADTLKCGRATDETEAGPGPAKKPSTFNAVAAALHGSPAPNTPRQTGDTATQQTQPTQATQNPPPAAQDARQPQATPGSPRTPPGLMMEDYYEDDERYFAQFIDPPFPPEGVICSPIDNRDYRINGITRKLYFTLVGRETLARWDRVEGPKVLAHIPGDQYRRDPSTTVDIVRAVAIKVTGNPGLTVLPATPQFPRLAEEALYVPNLIINISEEDRDKLTLKSLFSTDHGTIVTLAYDFSPSNFIFQLGETNLGNNAQHVGEVTSVIRAAIQRTGSAPYRRITQAHDNIPQRFTSAVFRTAHTASTVHVEAITILVSCAGGGQVSRARFSVFAESPSLSYDENQAWINSFSRLSLVADSGPLHIVEPFLCKHCSSRTHPSGLCPYSQLDGFKDTIFNLPAVQTAGTAHRGRGTGRGRGNRGRGAHGPRGRGGN